MRTLWATRLQGCHCTLFLYNLLKVRNTIRLISSHALNPNLLGFINLISFMSPFQSVCCKLNERMPPPIILVLVNSDLSQENTGCSDDNWCTAIQNSGTKHTELVSDFTSLRLWSPTGLFLLPMPPSHWEFPGPSH